MIEKVTKFTPRDVVEKRNKDIFRFYLNNTHLSLKQIGACLNLCPSVVSDIITKGFKPN